MSKKRGSASNRIRVIRLEPPRELDIRIDNPIEGARFEQYRILFNQEWEETKDDRFIARAENSDSGPEDGYDPVGDPFYSLYGVYGRSVYEGIHCRVGQDECIGDFKTFRKALEVLEGIGLIVSTDRDNLLGMADGMEML